MFLKIFGMAILNGFDRVNVRFDLPHITLKCAHIRLNVFHFILEDSSIASVRFCIYFELFHISRKFILLLRNLFLALIECLQLVEHISRCNLDSGCCWYRLGDLLSKLAYFFFELLLLFSELLSKLLFKCFFERFEIFPCWLIHRVSPLCQNNTMSFTQEHTKGAR